MDKRKISGKLIKQSLKEIGIKGTAIRAIDFIASRIIEQRMLRIYVNKKIMPYMFTDEVPIIKKKQDLNEDNIVWVCWFQGIENAPDLVKMCIKSLKANNQNVRIIVLTDDNISDYVEFPEYINRKYIEGKIKRPHYSDLLRSALLYCYGGCWVDSTMFFTESIPTSVWNSDMFVFKFMPNESRYQVASSQFIRAKQGNEILRRTLLGLFNYWKKKDKLITYYLFHYVFAAAVDSDKKIREKFDEIPLCLASVNHILQFRLFQPYSETEWRNIIRATFVHKLSYKHLEGIDKENTLYKYIVDDLNRG